MGLLDDFLPFNGMMAMKVLASLFVVGFLINNGIIHLHIQLRGMELRGRNAVVVSVLFILFFVAMYTLWAVIEFGPREGARF